MLTFGTGPEFKYCMDSVLGTGVFNSDGEMWKCVLFPYTTGVFFSLSLLTTIILDSTAL